MKATCPSRGATMKGITMHTTIERGQAIARLAGLTHDWDLDTLKAYRDNATKLANELEADGLDSSKARQDADYYAQVVIGRYAPYRLEQREMFKQPAWCIIRQDGHCCGYRWTWIAATLLLSRMKAQ